MIAATSLQGSGGCPLPRELRIIANILLPEPQLKSILTLYTDQTEYSLTDGVGSS